MTSESKSKLFHPTTGQSLQNNGGSHPDWSWCQCGYVLGAQNSFETTKFFRESACCLVLFLHSVSKNSFHVDPLPPCFLLQITRSTRDCVHLICAISNRCVMYGIEKKKRMIIHLVVPKCQCSVWWGTTSGFLASLDYALHSKVLSVAFTGLCSPSGLMVRCACQAVRGNGEMKLAQFCSVSGTILIRLSVAQLYLSSAKLREQWCLWRRSSTPFGFLQCQDTDRAEQEPPQCC